MEVIRLTMVGHIIFNPGTKSTVKSMAEGIVTIAYDSSVLVETDYILHDPVSVVHPKIFEFIFSVPDGVKWTKVSPEF